MELIVLGAHGTWPRAGGATSGYLVRHDGHTLWMDMGSGSLSNLQRHIGLFDVDAAFISHSHPDHVTDIYSYLFARMFSPERPPRIPLYVAPGVIERVQPLLSDETAEMLVSEVFDVVEMGPGDEIEVGSLRIRAAAMSHTVPTLGLRLEADGQVLTYSADTGPCEQLVGLAEGANLLVAEASWQEDEDPRPPIHLTAREAGETADRAGAERLLLTHIRPYLDWDRSREEASAAFPGDVRVALEGLAAEVGG